MSDNAMTSLDNFSFQIFHEITLVQGQFGNKILFELVQEIGGDSDARPMAPCAIVQ